MIPNSTDGTTIIIRICGKLLHTLQIGFRFVVLRAGFPLNGKLSKREKIVTLSFIKKMTKLLSSANCICDWTISAKSLYL